MALGVALATCRATRQSPTHPMRPGTPPLALTLLISLQHDNAPEAFHRWRTCRIVQRRAHESREPRRREGLRDRSKRERRRRSRGRRRGAASVAGRCLEPAQRAAAWSAPEQAGRPRRARPRTACRHGRDRHRTLADGAAHAGHPQCDRQSARRGWLGQPARGTHHSHGRLHGRRDPVLHGAGAHRRRRCDRALERSADDHRLEGRCLARRRLHRGDQAFRGDSSVGTASGDVVQGGGLP